MFFDFFAVFKFLAGLVIAVGLLAIFLGLLPAILFGLVIYGIYKSIVLCRRKRNSQNIPPMSPAIVQIAHARNTL